MKRDRPIPMGAMNVPLCFSAASMKIVKSSSGERNISMIRPWMTGVLLPRFVRTVRKPGKRAGHVAAAVMSQRI
jgi:hypothetical protein